MNILITGGMGFIGQNLAANLFLKKFNITILDDKNASLSCIDNEDTEKIVHNIHKISNDCVSYLNTTSDKYDLIIHLAAIPRVSTSLNFPYKVLANNIDSTLSVCEYCRVNNVKLINISSSSVKWTDINKNPYALSKKIAEDIVNTYISSFNIKAVNVRLFNVYGPGDSYTGENTTLIRKCQEYLMTSTTLPIYGDGTMIRDFTHVDDVCCGIRQIIKNMEDNEYDTLIELGSAHSYSVNDIIKHFKNLNVVYMPVRRGDALFTLSNSKMQPKGWHPVHNVLDYIDTWCNNLNKNNNSVNS